MGHSYWTSLMKGSMSNCFKSPDRSRDTLGRGSPWLQPARCRPSRARHHRAGLLRLTPARRPGARGLPSNRKSDLRAQPQSGRLAARSREARQRSRFAGLSPAGRQPLEGSCECIGEDREVLGWFALANKTHDSRRAWPRKLSVESIGIETGRRSADFDQMSEDPLELVGILDDGR
jgi:hypothetical protein